MIAKEKDTLVFVEVKHARSFDAALNSLRDRQIARICTAAEEFAGQYEHAREMRFDVALVNADGQVEIMENALMSA
ncbi:MAG: YraN family protein [Psychrosphaera sp.]|nr:YraN family protein [Psychrosphaera sp.]